jgi:hypothetical protein
MGRPAREVRERRVEFLTHLSVVRWSLFVVVSPQALLLQQTQ